MKSFYLLFILTISVVHNSFSQSAALKPFTNYGSCYQGLKSSLDGKIIWKAEFESLFALTNYAATSNLERTFWKAEKNGSFGLLDNEGKVVLPFEFSRIAAIQPGFVATKGGSSFLYSSTGEVLLELKNYDWFYFSEKGYIVDKNERIGFLDLDLNQLLAPRYDRISFATIQSWSEGRETVISDRFLEVELDKEKAIYDIQAKKFVVPLTSYYIHMEWAETCKSSDALFVLNQFEKDTMRVINSEGIEVFRKSHSMRSSFRLTSTDSCGATSIQLAYIESDRKMKILNLKTGKYSNEHIEIYPLEGYSIYFDEKKWGVITPDLKELKAVPYPKYEMPWYEGMENYSRLSTASDRFNILFQYLRYGERIDSVLITKKMVPKSKKNEREYEQFGLINFHSGKKVKGKYHEIMRRNLEDQTVYWAWIFSSPHDRYYERTIVQLDIYDSELNLIKRLENIDAYEFDHRSLFNKNYNVIIEQNGLKGVIDAFGNEVIPIKFEHCTLRKILLSKTVELYRTYYHCHQNGGETGKVIQFLFDQNGKKVILKEYRKITILDPFLIGSNAEGISDFYNFNGELVMPNVESYSSAPFVNEYGNCFDENGQYHSKREQCIYVVQNNFIHAYVNDAFLRLDENYFKFTENYCYFQHWWLIDKTGKIVTLQPEGIPKLPKMYIATYQRLTECSTFLNEYPVPVRTPQKRQPIAKIEKAPEHQWKMEPGRYHNRWFLYTPSGDLKYTEPFDFPTPTDRYSGGVFRRNGKYGRFDREFNVELKAEYDYIHPNGTLVMKDEVWYVRKGNSNSWSEGYDAVSTKKKRNLRFVFVEDKIGLIDDSLNYIIPLTDSALLLTKYDLVKTLNLQGHYNEKNRHDVNEIIFNGTPTLVYRKINNFHIIEEAYLHSTANETLDFSPVDGDHPDFDRSDELTYFKLRVNDAQIYRERIPTYYNKYFYSEITYTRNAQYYGNYLEGRQYADKAVYNYKIENNQLVPIELSDVLKSDKRSTDQLNQMILKKLTEMQAYGDNCTDIESKIDALKANFLVRGYSIAFLSDARGGFEIEFYFSELESLFRYPKKMLVRY